MPLCVNLRLNEGVFGYGYVLSNSGNTLEISFDKAGKKKLMADFVEVAS